MRKWCIGVSVCIGIFFLQWALACRVQHPVMGCEASSDSLLTIGNVSRGSAMDLENRSLLLCGIAANHHT